MAKGTFLLSKLYQRSYIKIIFPITLLLLIISVIYILTFDRMSTGPDLCSFVKDWDGHKNITRNWWEWTCLIEQEWDKDLDYHCRSLRTVGNYYICFDEPYTPKPPCLVYSFGIANDFRFDDAMAELGCDVYSFDPSMHLNDHQRSSRVHFYNIGIAAQDSDSFVPFEDQYTRNSNRTWKLRTLASLKKMLGHEHRPIDILKLDVETYEWAIIRQLLKNGDLHFVKQLTLEWHIFTSEPAHSEHQNLFLTYAELMKTGFKPYYVDSGARYHTCYYFNSQTDSSLINTLFRGSVK